jgi:hypothetical protein
MDKYRFIDEFTEEWNEVIKRLKESGYDLSNIKITVKGV